MSGTHSPLPDMLVVDLDGTLVRTDMLHESFWSSFALDWRTPFAALRALVGGRASLKRALARSGQIDVELLPFNEEVIDYITRWRAAGGRTALVTASDQDLADKVAAHVNLFDEVYGSDGVHNLKGANKAQFLVERYGKGRFCYMGDSPADLAVWESAGVPVSVNASAALRARVDGINGYAEHLSPKHTALAPYLKALRPHQWLKNILVFVPLLAGHYVTFLPVFQSVLAFVIFCCVASSVYVLNDLLDLSADRAHPTKRNRPFASGSVPISHGMVLATVPLAVGFGLSFLLGWWFVAVMLAYFAITTAYSLTLKRRAIVDICTLAALYTIRIVAGGAATGIELSVWLLAFSVFFFFALAAVKRQAELVDCAERGRDHASGRDYRVTDLPLVTQMATASGYVSVLVMALYVNSPAVYELYSMPQVLWGVCFVLLYWVSRIIMIAHRGNMYDDPVVFAVKDRISLFCLLLIFAMVLIGTMG